MRPEDLLARLEAGYEYDPMYGRLCNERDQLKADNAKLKAENARLRELVLDYFNAPCLECNPWDGGWEGCKHCESGNCTLAIRTLELGIEFA